MHILAAQQFASIIEFKAKLGDEMHLGPCTANGKGVATSYHEVDALVTVVLKVPLVTFAVCRTFDWSHPERRDADRRGREADYGVERLAIGDAFIQHLAI